MVTKKARQTDVELTFDLFDLPTAQHKAGLAGLVLQIGSMKERSQEFSADQIPGLEVMGPTRVRVVFTERSTQALIDDLYHAETRVVGEKKKYEKTQPINRFLAQHFPLGEGGWLKLWGDMIWSIPRGRHKQRKPFDERAKDSPTTEGKRLWKELVSFDKDREKGKMRTCAVSSSTLLGAQAINAEQIKFAERSDFAFLLHFWQIAVLVFVPQEIDNEGNRKFVGFSLAIPEVSDVERFCRVYPQILKNLPPEKQGFRPAGAVIDIPDEAGLEFMRQLHLVASRETVAVSRALMRCVSSCEFVHVVKPRNNVKTMSSGQIVFKKDLLDGYSRLMRASPGKPGLRNPLFRAGRLRSMLASKPWYWGMRKMLMLRDCSTFIRSADTGQTSPWFFHSDAKRQFEHEYNEYQREKERYDDMTDSEKATKDAPAASIPVLVHRMVERYVWYRTEKRSGIKYADFKHKKVKNDSGEKVMAVPKEYKIARRDVAEKTYLAMRSRRDRDFADYFTSTICSVPQFLPEEDYRAVATELLENTEDIKTLTLLALSANS